MNPNLETLDPLRAAFAERLKDKGYPQQTNNYGISFGRGNNTTSTKNAGNGAQWNNFGPGDRILKGNLTWVIVNFQSSAYAVQENNTNDYIAKYRFQGYATRKLFGFIPITVPTLRIRNFKYTGQYPYDEAPGGYEITQYIFATSLSGWANGAAVDATTDGHHGHNFVSVASALDLQNQDYDENNEWQSSNMFFNIDSYIQNTSSVNGNTLSSPSLSPFDAVITSTSNGGSFNNFHNSDITSNNSLFIIRRILNANPSFDCQTDAFCYLNPSINGSSILCTDGNYSVNNLPTGVSINWSSMFGHFFVASGQGTNQIIITKISNGLDTLILTLTSSCGISKLIKLGIVVGVQTPSNIVGINNPTPIDGGATITLYADASVTSYSWSVVGGTITTNNGSSIIVSVDNCDPNILYNSYINVYLTYTNACGTGNEYGEWTYVICNEGGGPERSAGPFISVYPNPVRDAMNVVIEGDNNIIYKGAVQINLIDFNTRMKVRNWRFPNNQKNYTLNVAGIKNGHYVIEIIRGEQRLTKIIVVDNIK